MKTPKVDFYDHPCCIALVEQVENFKRCSFLDLGCGNGRDLVFLAKNNLITIGMGIDDHHTPYIYKDFNKSQENIIFLRADIRNALIEISDASFDFICFNNSFEHIQFPEFVLYQCSRIAKQRGRLFITLPYDHHHDDPDHKNYYVPETLSRLVAPWFDVVECQKIEDNNFYLVGIKK